MMFCDQRQLYVAPADCRHCQWFECATHPKHSYWPAISAILKKCWTRLGTRRDRKKEWDGVKEHCPRWVAYRGDSKACAYCTLPRRCEHRPKENEQYAAKARTGMYGITQIGPNKFRVRLTETGRLRSVGTFFTLADAQRERDKILLKSCGAPSDRVDRAHKKHV